MESSLKRSLKKSLKKSLGEMKLVKSPRRSLRSSFRRSSGWPIVISLINWPKLIEPNRSIRNRKLFSLRIFLKQNLETNAVLKGFKGSSKELQKTTYTLLVIEVQLPRRSLGGQLRPAFLLKILDKFDKFEHNFATTVNPRFDSKAVSYKLRSPITWNWSVLKVTHFSD